MVPWHVTLAVVVLCSVLPACHSGTTPAPESCAELVCTETGCADVSCTMTSGQPECVYSNAESFDGQACNDTNPNTQNDKCSQGTCVGQCFTGLLDDGVCVDACPSGKEPDGKFCKPLQPQCGEHCFECDSTDPSKCARCTWDYLLDGGNCTTSCRTKKTNGDDDFTIDTDPDHLGKFCVAYVDPACDTPGTCQQRQCNTVLCTGFPYECVYTPVADGTTCDDSNSDTFDRCSNGACVGTCIGRAIQFGDECVDSCPGGYLQDGKQCVVPARGCGIFCLECKSGSSGPCARCYFQKKLDQGACVDTCTARDENGFEHFTTGLNGAKTCASPQTSEDSGGGLSGTAMLAIIVAGAVVGIAVIAIVIYVCVENRKTEAFDLTAVSTEPAPRQERPYRIVGMEMEAVPAPATLTLADVTQESSVDDFTEGGSAEEKELKKKLRKAGQTMTVQGAGADSLSASAAHAIDSAPVATLDEAAAKAFFTRLSELKKDKSTFAVILQEMKRRRDTRRDVASKQKYDKLVTDLHRLMHLFKQKKSDRTVPADGPQLLIWAKKTLDRYLGQQARLALGGAN